MGVKNRGDVKRLIYNLWIQRDIGKIKSEKDFINKVTNLYEQAFDNELRSLEGKESLINIKKYEASWKNVFKSELGGILGREKAESLFLLSWVESNVKNTKKNKYGARGYFQITNDAVKDVNKENSSKYIENDLSDPLKSAEVAAKHLKLISERIKRDNPEISKAELLNLAITKYNGGLYTRLNKNYRTKPIDAIFKIYKELNWIKKDTKIKTSKDMIKRLEDVQRKYYSKGKNHFRILDMNKSGVKFTKEKISKLIDNYVRKILTQQNMYAIQFQAIKKSYLKYSNTSSYAKN